MGNALRFRDDAAHEEPAVTLDAFLGQSNATAVRLESEFRDGRGYSAARILREAGYTGELRAAGDVLVDQIPFMRRCGFDSFAPEADIDADALGRALARYEHVYQKAADGRSPVWGLRHG